MLYPCNFLIIFVPFSCDEDHVAGLCQQDMKAMSSIHDFRANFFQEEYDKTLKNKDVIEEQIKHKLKELVAKLDENEKLIMELRKGV